jgi:hypothetical protein
VPPVRTYCVAEPTLREAALNREENGSTAAVAVAVNEGIAQTATLARRLRPKSRLRGRHTFLRDVIIMEYLPHARRRGGR